jgi:hypothetical protein
MMRYIRLLVILSCLLPLSVLSQVRHEFHDEDEPERKVKREAWMREMHRAEPGVNTIVIDNEVRTSKAMMRMSRLRSFQSPQTLTKDTIADGRIIGSWSERGSNNVAGRMHTCDIDWLSGYMYAASSYGNIWKGKLDGSEWKCLNNSWRFADVRMIRLIPIAGGHRILVIANGPARAYYSDDDGKTWDKAKGLEGPESWGWFRRAISSPDGDTIHVLGGEWDYSSAWRSVGTAYISTDAGKTFKNLFKGAYRTEECDIWRSRYENTPVYIIKSDTIGTLSSDGKISVLAIKPVTASSPYFSLRGVQKDTSLNLTLFNIHDNKSYIEVSTDKGNSWTNTGMYNGAPFDWNNSMAVSYSNPDSLFIGGVDVYRSFDQGANWNKLSSWGEYYGNPAERLHADIPSIEVFRDHLGDEHVVVMTDGGTYISSNGLQDVMNITLEGIGTSQYYDVLTSTSNDPYHIFAGSQDQGFQKGIDSSDGTLGFRQSISGDYGHLTSSDSGRSVWSNYPGFSMYYPVARTSDHQRGKSFVHGNRLWIPPIVADPADPKTAYVASGSGDSSIIWKYQYVLPGDSIITERMPFDFSGGKKDNRVSQIAISPIADNHWYVTTTDGRFFHSVDRGKSWAVTDSFSAPGSHYFYGSSIVPSQTKLGELYIGGSGYSNPGVFFSSDHGATFVSRDSGLPKTLVYGMASSPNGDLVFAGTEIGPYVYVRETNQWYDMTAYSAPDHVYWSVEYVPQIKTVRFGTHGRGIWDFKINEVKSAVQAERNTPVLTSSLRPTKTLNGYSITTYISERANVELRVYDLTGRMVSELYQGELPAGVSSFEWNTANAPSGAYLVIVNAEGNVAFTKLVVSK